MLTSGRRAGLVVAALGGLIVTGTVSGLLTAGVAAPIVGVLGVATRDAANTFNTLSVPNLGQVPSRSEILDSRGHLIAYYYPGGIDRVPVSYNQISPAMRNAIVAIEDARFYQHGALDPRGTVRALVNNLAHHPVQGGSTLAQQYVKNALILTALTPKAKAAAAADNAVRKIRELRIAANVEHEMTKHQLLAAYLSVAYFENGAYGIQVAAERYFSVPAKRLYLTQAAMLAGLVENPVAYDPFLYPKNALARRNTVLARMAQLGYITKARAAKAEAKPLGLHPSRFKLQSGCTAKSARAAAFFCDYVLAEMRNNNAYAKAQAQLNSVGGLKIYTTLNPQDQRAANYAVRYVQPARSGVYNPGHNVDTEALIQPGTGAIKAIAVDRPYGNGRGHTTVDYAVPLKYDGGEGVQTGSSSKIFTLITALKQGIPFGFSQSITSPSTIAPYYNCQGQPTGPFDVTNAEGAGHGTFTLYNGTTQSINVFYAHLEQKVGLCNVVKTAASMGMTRADGTSLLRRDPHLPRGNNLSADNYPSFTLGSVPVAPLNMAAAYATVASRGIYCRPVAISKIVTTSGARLPVALPHCHRVLSTAVADAANYIFQGVITSGTAVGLGIGVPAAAKTGTANGGYYAAFAGWTPRLVGYVSVFNPLNPTTSGAMIGIRACYRALGGLNCPSQMFGANAPGSTWQITFLHAALGSPPAQFVGVPPTSPFFAEGTGQASPKPPPPPHQGGGGGGHGHGNGGGHGHGGGNHARPGGRPK